MAQFCEIVYPPIEDRTTAPGTPGSAHGDAHYGALSHAWYMLGGEGKYRPVNEHTAQTLSAVWRAVKYISQSIATLGWHVYERSADGRSKLPMCSARKGGRCPLALAGIFLMSVRIASFHSMGG